MTAPRPNPLPAPGALEARLTQSARDFAYPPAPDLSRTVDWVRLRTPARHSRSIRPGLALAGILLAALLAVILLVPPVRAAVLDWVRLGAVRIFLVQPTPAPTPLPHTPAPLPSPTPLSSLLDLTGETTLASARQSAGFDPRLPASLPAPDRVYYQDIGGPILILVWLDPKQPAQPKLALFVTDEANAIFTKVTPKKITDTTVSGRPAVWVEGPYLLITGSGEVQITRLIQTGRTLVWTDGPLTYRLETTLTLEEAVKIAETIP